MPTLLALYLERPTVKNYSPGTIEQADGYVHHFLAWCAERSAMRATGDGTPPAQSPDAYQNETIQEGSERNDR
jgi:hypothetical protein